MWRSWSNPRTDLSLVQHASFFLPMSFLTLNCASVSSQGRLQPVIYGLTHAMVITCKWTPSSFSPTSPPNLARLSTMGSHASTPTASLLPLQQCSTCSVNIWAQNGDVWKYFDQIRSETLKNEVSPKGGGKDCQITCWRTWIKQSDYTFLMLTKPCINC